jgi:hypothetical protein
MSGSIKVALIAVSALLFCPQAIPAAEEHHDTDMQTGAKIHLSVELHRLLGKEMVAIENGMKDLIPAIASGDWEHVASIGQKISDSFIMKQALTADQKKELHRELPPQFIEMDQDFHKSAAMLAHAAGMKNADVVNFYFFKLNSACVACHKKYAAERFPGLAGDSDTDRHEH